MRTVQPIVYRCRWLLLVPWVCLLIVYGGWLAAGSDVPGRREIVLTIDGYMMLVGAEWRYLQPGLDDVAGMTLYPRGKHTIVLVMFVVLWAASLVAFLRPKTTDREQWPARRALGARAIASLTWALSFLLLSIVALAAGWARVWDRLILNLSLAWNTQQGHWIDPANLLPLSILTVVCYAISLPIVVAMLQLSNQVRYWRFETVTRWLVISSIGVCAFSSWQALSVRLLRIPDEATYAAQIFATATLLWAWLARVILLFRLRSYERAVREDMLCYACGYDLRATVGKSCPECGTIIVRERVQTA